MDAPLHKGSEDPQSIARFVGNSDDAERRQEKATMTTPMIRFATLGVVTVLLSGCGSPAPEAPPPTPDVTQQAPTTAKPEVSINAVMVGLVDHAAHNLWDVERPDKAPKTDA